MSTQDGHKTIPLAFAHDQSPIRLLELSPSLLSLIENSTFKGSSPVLKIKASPSITSDASSSSSSSSGHPAPFAVLTTATDTFNIRSVHSSNSIFILKPGLIPTIPKTTRDGDDGENGSDTEMADIPAPSTKPGVIVTSTCASHLELLPSKPNVELILRPVLTEYVSPETPPTRPSDAPSKTQTLLDTPASDAEFAQGWIDVTAFELDNWAVRLAPSAALHIFKAIVTIMYAVSGTNSEWRTEGVGLNEIVEAIKEDGELEEWPADAIGAVVRGGWELKRGSDGSLAYMYNPSHGAKWVGKQVLLANPDKSFRESEFKGTWQEAVPPDCTDLVDLKTLGGLYTQSVLGVIRYIHGSAATEAGTTAAASKKKKWHEKFASGKKR
ncbi:hypothetical protein ABW20_dc0108388 [Dactylellina cionopaga]|nr:hypothetical protein ABW20_dc0108388 [Dactylellina cionopaga]